MSLPFLPLYKEINIIGKKVQINKYKNTLWKPYFSIGIVYLIDVANIKAIEDFIISVLKT